MKALSLVSVLLNAALVFVLQIKSVMRLYIFNMFYVFSEDWVSNINVVDEIKLNIPGIERTKRPYNSSTLKLLCTIFLYKLYKYTFILMDLRIK